MVFGGSPVNIVVLPYAFAPYTDNALSEAARGLSALIQLDTFSSARYGGLGIPVLRGDKQQCAVNLILDRILTSSGPFGELQPTGGVILMWGQFFETDDKLFLQTFLRIYRHETDDALPVRVTAGDRSVVFAGHLPSTGIAFRPRQVAKEGLKTITKEYSKVSTLKREPRANSEAVGIDVFEREFFAFQVRFEGSGWLRLKPFGGAEAGFVQVGGETSTFLLELLPELAFIDGLVGYLTFRAVLDGRFDFRHPELGRMAKMIRERMDRFLEFAGPEGEEMATAFALTVPVAVDLLRVHHGAVGAETVMSDVRTRLAKAVKLIPDNVNARVLEAIARIHDCCESSEDIEALEADLYRAMTMAPRSMGVLRTVQGFYELLEGSPGLVPAAERDLVAKRRAALERLTGGRVATQTP